MSITEPNAMGPGIPPVGKQQHKFVKDEERMTVGSDLELQTKTSAYFQNTMDLPNVRTTIHWMPSPKDLWLSGTHLHSTELVRHAVILDLKLHYDVT